MSRPLTVREALSFETEPALRRQLLEGRIEPASPRGALTVLYRTVHPPAPRKAHPERPHRRYRGGGTGNRNQDGSAATARPLGARRARNRVRNAAARVARRKNRR